MNLKLTRVEVWTAEIDDKPGGLALTLRAVADMGADLDYVAARRQTDKPGKGVLYLSPMKGREQLENAGQAGLRQATELPILRIEGGNEPGAGATIAKAMADAGINLTGLSAVAVGNRFVCHAAFDTAQDLEKAEAALAAFTGHGHSWRFWERHPHSTAA